MLTPEEVQAMVQKAQEQGSQEPAPVVTKTTVKVGEIIEPTVPVYKTPEELREEASNLALETERLQEITTLEARLVEDYSLTEEGRKEIEEKLKALKPTEETEESNLPETPEQEIARLRKELEEAKNPKKETKNPLEEVENKAKEAGIDIPEMYKEYINNGELSPESLKSLLDAGFNQTAIDAYIETKTVQSQAEADALISSTVGTKEVYTKMADWMIANLTEAELDTYNNGVNSEHAKIYIENMFTKYSKAVTPPTIIRDNGYVREGNQVKGFVSLNAQTMALADYRYGRDAKYTAEVRSKMLQTTAF